MCVFIIYIHANICTSLKRCALSMCIGRERDFLFLVNGKYT